MYLWISIGLFLLFVGNVAMGSINGQPLLNDVSEMLLLMAVSGFFVAAILRAQRDANYSKSED